jgi:hypothetical protein
MQKNILSIDCANKTLAVVGITTNISDLHNLLNFINQSISRINTIYDIKEIEKIIATIENLYFLLWRISYTDCVDLIPGKKSKEVSVVERCTLLKNFIAKVNKIFPADIVLIENQMTPNEKTHGIMYCLAYEYSEKSIIVNPRIKNKLNFGAGTLSDFIMNYADIGKANKEHVIANFNIMLSRIGCSHTNINKKTISHIGDAVFQVIAYYGLPRFN